MPVQDVFKVIPTRSEGSGLRLDPKQRADRRESVCKEVVSDTESRRPSMRLRTSDHPKDTTRLGLRVFIARDRDSLLRRDYAGLSGSSGAGHIVK
jgi:hypothetical protein